MNALEILQHPQIKELAKKQEEVNRQKAKAGYNLFTISSYTAHLENFHSDVIASLLDPDGLHGEGYTFLHLFIDYLNFCHLVSVKKEDFADTTVVREKGRVDVWIKDETSRQCIIIENKINNAPDREDQLIDYYNHAVASQYNVNSVVYLSLDGRKLAPANKNLDKSCVRNIPAYKNTESDLLNGWLTPCLKHCTNENSSSFIKQYSNLIAHLGNNNMDKEIREQFYQLVCSKEHLADANLVKELVFSLPDYRADIFSEKIQAFHPFRKKWRRYNNYWIFEQFVFDGGYYKLDVWFEANCNANVVFWREDKGNEDLSAEQRHTIARNLLAKAGLLDKFTAPGQYNGMAAKFTLDEFITIDAIDNAVLELVDEVFKKLIILTEQPR